MLAQEMVALNIAASRDEVEDIWLDAPHFFANRLHSHNGTVCGACVERLRWRLNFTLDHVPPVTRERIQQVLDFLDSAERVAEVLKR